jgi:PAS domain S-box-containing protein
LPRLPATYDPAIVALSVVISIVAAYAACSLSERVRDARGRLWLAWLAGGAAANGIGTWSMHFTGMLALRLPVPVRYNWPAVLLSLLVGIAGSAAALLLSARRRVGWLRVLGAGVMMGGVGIAGLHFTAMAAMRGPMMLRDSTGLVVLSVVLSIGIASVGLGLTYLVPDDAHHRIVRIHGAALARGSANPIMHYTAMSAVSFLASGAIPDWSHSVRISSLGILGVSVVPTMVLGVAILTSCADRLRMQRVLLDELFGQAPEAVALTNTGGRVLRINREFTRLFGYSAQEAVGRSITDLIVPDEERHSYAVIAPVDQRVVCEGLRRRKDGSSLYVSIVRVHICVPGGDAELYAIYRDITEQKEAERRIRSANEKLRALSASLQSAREDEAASIAREIHDELGSALTGVKWGLEELGKTLADPGARAKVESLARQADAAIAAVRRIASELRPSVLDDLGLIEAIEWQARQFQARTGIVCVCESTIEEARLGPEQATAAFRILQEALTNVLRHARASRVNVKIEEIREEAVFVLTIRDNGRGIREDEKWGRQSLGLLGMQERARILGGEVEIAGSDGTGTVVSVRMPFSG